MTEIYSWTYISTNAYEEDFSRLKHVVEDIHLYVKKTPPLQRNVHITQGWSVVTMGSVLNHFSQIDPYIDFFRYIAERAPASYGLLYFRSDEITLNRDTNRFYVLRMARGIIEELEDTFLSPCVPLIED